MTHSPKMPSVKVSGIFNRSNLYQVISSYFNFPHLFLSRKLFLIFLLFFCITQNADSQVCGTSGIDGPQNAVPPVNTYFPLGSTASLVAGSKTLTLLAVPPNDPNYNLSYGVTPIKSGDLILIIQMQDATFDYTNSNVYGSGLATFGADGLGGTGYTGLGTSGKFEYVVATSNVPLTGGVLTFRGAGAGSGAVNTYTNADFTATRGQRRFQVVRVPQYSNLILNSTITTPPYNGSVGGLIAFDVAGTMQFNGFIVDASERGFRGGYGPVATSGTNTNSVYAALSSSTRSVGKGEGIAGTPRYMWDGFNQVDNLAEGLPGGSYGRGAPANAGGAGNDHNAGGGGGGNGGFGGVGGRGWQGGGGNLSPLTSAGRPGSSIPADVSRLIMGGGGGGGDANNATSGVKGGVGGGIILINVEKIDGVGVIKSNGGVGQAGAFGSSPDGAGGGGAGGSIFVRSLAASPTANLTLEAKGGNGGNTKNDAGNEHGPGGGGGGGQIYTQVPSATILSDAQKGIAGKANNGAGITHGAANGFDGNVTSFITSDLPSYLQGGGSICYPILDVTLTELNAGAAGARAAGTTATYKLRVTNNIGGGNAGDVNVGFLMPYGFSLSTISATLSGDVAGPTSPAFTVGATGNITLGSYNISPGDYVEFTILVNIASNIPSGIYHASAQASYLDPTRTSVNPVRKITANDNPFAGSNTNYETGGISDVPGTNYNGELVTKSAEDVYINALAATDCNAVVNGDFSSGSLNQYGAPSYFGSWGVVNPATDKVNVVQQYVIFGPKGALIRNNGSDHFSLQQTVNSIKPSSNYTLTFSYSQLITLGCGSNATSKMQVEILDGTTNAVIVPATEFNANSYTPLIGNINFTTLASTNSVILKIIDPGSPNPACGVFIDNITITSPLSITTTKNNVSCKNLSDGSIVITSLANAAPPYKVSYSSDGGATYSTQINSGVITGSDTPISFTGLAAGNYIVKISDQNGCITTRNITINEPNILTLTGINTSILCYAGTSTVTLTAGGGTAPYQYSIDGTNFQGLNTFPDLIQGSYTFTVVDANSCSTTFPITITQPVALTLTGTNTSILCHGGASTVTLSASGGTGSLQYSLDGIVFQASNIFNGVLAGPQTFTVKDGNECIKTLLIDIAEPSLLTLAGANNDILCHGATADVTLTAVGGTGAYEYSKDGITFQTSNIFNVAAGSHTFTVKDANGCLTTFSTSLTEPAALTLTGTNAAILCNGGTTTVTLTASAGTGTYQYSKDGTTFQASNVFAGILAGAQTFTVKDANSCIKTFPISITEPSLLSLTATNTAILCNGGTATVTLSASGGTSTYQYSKDGVTYQSSNTFASQIAGSYTFYVKDFNNCIQTKTLIITEPAVLAVAETHQNINCFGDATGSIDVTISGGTLPYTFTWTNGETALDQSNLAAGTYTLNVTDANSCTISKTIIITQPPVISIAMSRVNVKCYGEATGGINVTLTGGTAPYTFEWNNGAITEDLNNVTAGNYSVTVTDSNGCLGFASLSITQPAAALTLTETHINNTCFAANAGSIDLSVSGGVSPYLYSWSSGQTIQDIASLAPGNYTVTVTDANSCTSTKTITITPLTPFTLSSSKIDVICNGAATGEINLNLSGGTLPYTIIWSNGATTANLQNLVAGTYSYTATDNNGCVINNSVTIIQPSALTFVGVNTSILCAGGTSNVTLTTSGGTGIYQYSKDGITFQSSNVYTDLLAGDYTFTVKDANNCIKTFSITISEPTLLTLTGSNTNILCFGETSSVTLTASGGTGAYQYSKDGITFQSSNSFSSLTAGTYTFSVKDANNCTKTFLITISEPTLLTLTGSNTNILCFGETSSVTLTASGGTGAYQYSKDGITFQSSNSFSGLTAGTYTFTVKDVNDCVKTFTTTIAEPTLLTLTGSNTAIQCNAGVSTVTLTSTGGSGTNLFSKDGINYQSSNQFNTLTAGAYTFYVKDVNGCQVTFPLTITEPAALTLSISTKTDATCNATSTGSVTAGAINNAVGTITYSWKNSANVVVGTTATVNNQPADTYTLTITDNCFTRTNTVSIAEPAALTLATSTKTDATCNATSTGSVTAGAVNNVVGTVTYSWKNSANVEVGTTETITNLLAGVYTLTISDNCFTRTNTVTITEPAALTLGTSTKTDATCNATSTGSVTAGEINNSVGTVTYSWKNSSNVEIGTTATVNNLPAGVYTLTVTDDCFTRTNTVTISEPAALTLAISTKTDATCNTTSTGSVTAGAVNNAVGVLTYSWKNSVNVEVGTTATVNNLPADTYTLTVTDNCFTRTNTVTISEPAALTLATSTKTDATCNATSTGSVTAGTVNNAVGVLTYSWKNSANVEVGTTVTVNNLPADTYTLTVTDDCFTRTNTVTIAEPAALTLAPSTKTDATCNATSTGSVTAGAINNAVGTVTYSWKNSVNVVIGTTATVNNLPADTYTLTVTDDCFTRTNTVTIAEPAALTLAPSTKTDATCNATSTGSVTAGVVNNAVGTLTYSWKNSVNVVIGTTATVNNLPADTYTLTVTDDCFTRTNTVTIAEPAALTLAISTKTDATCNATSTGSVTAGAVNNAVGTITYIWKNSANVEVGTTATI
ncbi:hypothetical protein FA046_05225, partial [Pedobacter cryophilus]